MSNQHNFARKWRSAPCRATLHEQQRQLLDEQDSQAPQQSIEAQREEINQYLFSSQGSRNREQGSLRSRYGENYDEDCE